MTVGEGVTQGNINKGFLETLEVTTWVSHSVLGVQGDDRGSLCFASQSSRNVFENVTF